MRTAVFVNYNKPDPYLPPSLFAQQNQVVNQTTTTTSMFVHSYAANKHNAVDNHIKDTSTLNHFATCTIRRMGAECRYIQCPLLS